MPPNRPPHKRQKSSISNLGGIHFVEDKQELQQPLPSFNIPGQQPLPQPQTTSASSYANLDPSSFASQQVNALASANRYEEQDMYNYAYAQPPPFSNITYRQGPLLQRSQYEYNQESQTHTQREGQSHPRRITSTGSDRYQEYPTTSSTAPPTSAASTNFNYQHAGAYEGTQNQSLYQHQQHHQRQQQYQQQHQQQQQQPIPHRAQQGYYTDPNFQRPHQRSSSYVPAPVTNPPVGGNLAFNPAFPQLSPVYPTFDFNYSNPQQALFTESSTSGNRQFSHQQASLSGGSLQPSIHASSIASGPPSIPASVVTTAPTPIPAPAPATARTQPSNSRHQKNNLSISSHLTSITLGGAGGNAQENVYTSQHPRRFHRDNDSLLNEVLHELFSVDGNNMASYLHSLLCKINTRFPLDDFYNLLYNNDRQIPLSAANFNYNLKIDRTPIAMHSHDSAAIIINQVLDAFRNPAVLLEIFPNLDEEEDGGQNRLMSINYHELLRTFLAIKILNDMMIQIPSNTTEDPSNYSIPRLSIFKTYFIICQKLITRYPSSSNTANEQQKLILGQSKLGKLIKMVYPDIPIKRLGSRGESRYHYLGVVWNEHIIDYNIKQLCEQHDLTKLNEMFSEGNPEQQGLLFPQGIPTDVQLHLEAIPTGVAPKKRGRKRSRSSGKEKPIVSGRGGEICTPEAVTSPRMSFITKNLMYPTEANFTVLDIDVGPPNWFSKLLDKAYAKAVVIDRNLITLVLLTNSNLLEGSSLFNNLLESVFEPVMAHAQTIKNLDLILYTIIILEILPYLLLFKPSADINLVTNLRLNLLYLVNNFPSELSKLSSKISSVFPSNNVAKFLHLIKKLIDLNDLLITFIKLLNKRELNSMMASEIQQFLDVKPAGIRLQEGEDFLSNIMGSSGGTGDGAGGGDSGGGIRIDDANFNFRTDILLNDLIHTLSGFRYDPNAVTDLKRSSSIDEEVAVLDEFFRTDLKRFLAGEDEPISSGSSSLLEHTQRLGADIESMTSSMRPGLPSLHSVTPINPPIGQPTAASSLPTISNTVLTTQEMTKLKSLLALIDTKLLSNHFKLKYPIQLYNNLITFILNDILKRIFIKQQQQQLRRSQMEPTEEGSNAQPATAKVNLNLNSGESSFGSWWVFNSFVSEYLSLLGEIVGLQDLI
ncbi:unnamed protein product [Candida parapsilosis]